MHPTPRHEAFHESCVGARVMPGVRFPKHCMHYWRDNSFQVLAEAANYASAVPAWAEYGRFCELLEKGLRKDAFKHLAAFIEDAAEWSFEEKRKFVSWLYHFAGEREDSFLLLPQPLHKGFLEPALREWVEREPESGEPHRWFGTHEHLKEAVRLDPADEIARERLANMVFGWIGYSTHELPYGYIGNPEEDLQMLSEVEPIISGISDKAKRAEYQGALSELREEIYAYLRGRAET
jgi:hypothetical protein